MKILAFDTALDACSAALWSDGRVLGRASVIAARGHAEMLFSMLADVLAEAGLDYGDIDRFAVTTGPGSFTGVRVGLAAARGLSLARGKPVVGVTTLEALAATAMESGEDIPTDTRLGVAIDARRSELYVQIFETGPHGGLKALSSPEIVAHADAPARFTEPMAIVGSGASIVEAALGAREGLRFSNEPLRPDAGVVARLAAERKIAADQPPPSPLYLRAPDAKLPGGVVPPVAASRS